MVNNSKRKNLGVNERGPGFQLSVQIAMGLPGEWIRRDYLSSFSQLPDFQPFLPVIHTCIGAPTSMSHSSLFWWVFWIIRNETTERTPESLSSLHVNHLLKTSTAPRAQLTSQAMNQKSEAGGTYQGSELHTLLLELPVLLCITRVFWWQMLREEKHSQFCRPVCVFGEAAGRKVGCRRGKAVFHMVSKDLPGQWWQLGGLQHGLGAVFTDFSSQPLGKLLNLSVSHVFIHKIAYPHLRVVLRLQWVNVCRTLKILPACPPHRE